MFPRPPTTRPITRPSEKRPHPLTGRERLEAVLRRYRAQLRPGAFEVLVAVKWVDLHRTRDAKLLDDQVRDRLSRVDHRAYLVDCFDPKVTASPLVPLWNPPR